MHQLRMMKLIWVALMSSLFIYGFILFFLFSGEEASVPFEFDQFSKMITGVACLTGVMSFVVPIFLKNTIGQVAQQDSLEIKAQRFFTPFIISLALSEAVAIYGFALAFVKRSPNLFLPFVSVAVFLFVIRFPKEDKIKNYFN